MQFGLRHLRKLNREYIKFLVIGLSAFLIDFSILNTLVYVFGFRTQLFNFVLVANVVSTVTAVLFGFYFHKHWTFNSKSYKKIKNELFLFVGLQLFNIVVYNSVVFNIFVNVFEVPIPISKILVAGMQMVTSYIVMKFWIFSNSEKEPSRIETNE